MSWIATHREVGAGGKDARDGRGGEERRLPPGPRAPAVWQSLQWVLRPVPFMEGCRRRFGDTFTLKLGPLADVVFLTEPESIKAAYQAPPELAHAGDINGLFRPILGSHSLLLLDGDEAPNAETGRRRHAADLADRDDVLSLLLLARDEDGVGMTDVEVRDQLLTLLVSGHETGATQLAWTFERLLRHPEALARVHADVETGGHLFTDARIRGSMRL